MHIGLVQCALLWCCLILTPVAPLWAQETLPQPRAREAGVVVGILPTGTLNAITDVEGVQVGHATVVEGDSVRTGVTAILPHGGNVYHERVPAAVYVGNGYGKLLGVTQVRELGELETPILLTCTLCVWNAASALVDTLLAQPDMHDVRSINPVVGETNDGRLSDIRAQPVAAVEPAVAGALGTAERQVHHGALPGHPHREADALLFGDGRVVPEPALVRAADAVVLGPVAGEHLDRPVVPLDRDGDLVDLLRVSEPLDDPLVEPSIQLLEEGPGRDALTEFRATKELPDPVESEFVQTLQTVLDGLEGVAVTAEELYAAISEGGARCTVPQLRERFDGFVAQVTREQVAPFVDVLVGDVRVVGPVHDAARELLLDHPAVEPLEHAAPPRVAEQRVYLLLGQGGRPEQHPRGGTTRATPISIGR